MYVFNFIRGGKGFHCNVHGKGAFTKRFNTLSEVVSYMERGHRSIYFASHEEWDKLTPRERHILREKFKTVTEKHNRRAAKNMTNHIRDKLNELGISSSTQKVGSQ